MRTGRPIKSLVGCKFGKLTVIKLFDISPQYDNPILKTVFIDRILKDHNFPISFSYETADKAVFGRDYFKRKESVNDIFLTSIGSYWYSPIYYHNNEPFLFTSSFALQFRALVDEFKDASKQETMLTVIDVGPEITNGTECCGPHGNYSRTETVKPTTVEEYTLILYIAQKLGVKDLKPIVLPK